MLIGVLSIAFPSTVDSVVISPEGAFIFAHIDLKISGDTVLIVEGVPTPMENNVIIRCKDCIITGKRFSVKKLPYDPEKDNEMNRELKRINSRLSILNSELKSVDYRLKLINAVIEGMKGGRLANPSQLLNLSRTIEKDEILKDSLQILIDSIKKHLDSLVSIKDMNLTEQGELHLYLSQCKDPTLNLYITYFPGMLGWKPKYMAEYSEGKIHITSYAEIVSALPKKLTANKIIITNLPPAFYKPEHEKWYISDYYPYVGFGRPEMKALAAESLSKEVKPQQPEVVFTEISTKYIINRKVVIDRERNSVVKLFEKTYEGREVLEAYPEISDKGLIKFIFTPDADLPKGQMDVLYNGEYSANYMYDGSIRDNEDTLFLGFDPSITCEIKLLSQKKSDVKGVEKQLLTKETRIHEISIRNYKDRDVEILVYGRKPFAGGRVNIEEIGFEPGNYEDLGEGLLRWKVKLEKGKSFLIKRTITITYPKGAQINW